MEADEQKQVVILNPRGQDLTKASESVKKELPKYWDRDYINQRISQVKKLRHQMLLRFLWLSGVRITEAISLSKQAIDFGNYTMRLRWLKSRKYKERIAPMHPRLKDILEVYTAAMRADERVFPITRQRAWQITKKNLGGHPHQLRHSFAVNWLRCGGDIVILHRVMGHSTIQTTMEYLNIVPIDQGKELLKI